MLKINIIDKTGFSDIDLYIKVPLTMGKLTLTPRST